MSLATTPKAAGGNERERFCDSVIAGLSATPKRLEPRFFYDRVGARLFEAITELDAYYPTRTELAILRRNAGEIAAEIGEDVALVELGSGEGAKVRILLDALGPRVASYVPVDISADQLADAADRLNRAYPRLEVIPLAADFLEPLALPPLAARGPCVAFFPGSTIGNLAPSAATTLLQRLRTELGADRLLIGVDRKKDAATLIEAYDDPAGVTAAFNRNILQRINRELDGTFVVRGFAHEARWNAGEGRVEMHLVADRAQRVSVAGHVFAFAAGETIHTESSYKYAPEEFRALAAGAGWRARRTWTDGEALFSVTLLDAAPDGAG